MLTIPAALALTALLSLTPEEPTSLEATPDTAESEAVAPEEATPESRELSRITLEDGQVLRGVVVHRDAQRVVVELVGGSRMELPAEAVASVELETRATVEKDGELRFVDPNRTRYLYAPSAMMLRAGEGYVSQKELFFTSFSYGVTDFLTLQAGSAVPFWFTQGGFNLIGGLKIGGPVQEDRLHLAAGAQVLTIPNIGTAGIGNTFGLLFGTATYGTPDIHFSVAMGTPFLLTGGAEPFPGQLILTASGNVRMTKSLALVTENWMLIDSTPYSLEPPMLNSLALRIFGEQWAVDVGAIRVPYVSFPVPWLDFTYNFG